MKKELAKYLSNFQGVDIDNPIKLVDPEPDFEDSNLKQVLDEIFAVDPISGLPKGDIQYWLSNDGNPQVKQWLEANLLQPRVVSGSNVKDVTDDVIAEMSRRPDESVSDYESRLMGLYDSAKQECEKNLALLKNPID